MGSSFYYTFGVGMSNPAHWRMIMAIQFKPTIPPEGIRAVCLSVMLCKECNEFSACMFQLNEPQFRILRIHNAERICDTCYDKAYAAYVIANPD